MNGARTSHLQSLLIEIAAEHHARLPTEDVTNIAGQDRELLVDVLLRELARSGLDADDEPNERGADIEAIIDLLGAQRNPPGH